MVLPLIFGIAQGAAGIAGAFGDYQQQQAAISSRNQAAIDQYRQRLLINTVNTNNSFNRYRLQVNDYQRALTENSLSAGKAYASEQMRLNEIVKAAAFKAQERNLQTQQAIGSLAARGVSGQSAAQARRSVLAAAGRNEAISMAGIDSARDAYRMRVDNIRDQLRIANYNAYRPVQYAPEATPNPLAPTMQDAPSTFGLLNGIGSSVLSGLQGFYQMDDLVNG